MEEYLKKYNIIFLVVILAIAVFFRFYQLKTVPPGLYPDEAMNGSNALAGGYKIFYPENNGREGMFINIQSLSVRIFGNEPWALRLVSAVFGILTVLGLYLLTKEIFKKETVAMLASFFMAVSFWHINFSRIGFRAIMAPFFLVWGLWLVWKLLGSSTSKWKLSFLAVLGGFVFGLGFHSYIAYRATPVLLIIPFWTILIKNKKILLTALFLAGFLIAIYPLANYFYSQPQDFLGRTSQISIFSTASPVKEFLKNTFLTIGMFFWHGDSNWRHNISGAPQLWWPVAILFLIGFIISIKNWRLARYNLLIAWLIFMLLPVIISSEGLPHALRGIIVIPVAMILAALGLDWLGEKIKSLIQGWTLKFQEYEKQIRRIKIETTVLLFVFLISLAGVTYKQYFFDWDGNHNVALAFNKGHAQLGDYLKHSPVSIKKYVIINANGVEVNGIPMPSQTIMFLTDTFSSEKQVQKNIFYILPKNIDNFIEDIKDDENFQIYMLENDNSLRRKLLDGIPGLFTYENGGILIQEK